MASVSDEPLFRVRNVFCRFEDFRQAVIDMAAPRGRIKRELRSDPTLFFDRFIVENGQKLKNGYIKFIGGKDKKLRKCVLKIGENRRAIYRIYKLKELPSRVYYYSVSGRSRLCWKRCNSQEKREEWMEGRLYGAVSENSFKKLADHGVLPDFMVPNLEIEASLEARHIRRLERFIVEKYLKKSWSEVFSQPGVHVEASGTFLRFYVEASEKKVLSEVEEPSGVLQTVWVRGVLGVIARLEPDFNLAWRVREWPRGILRGRLNLRGLKILSELDLLVPEAKVSFNPIVMLKRKKPKKDKQTSEGQPKVIEEQAGE